MHAYETVEATYQDQVRYLLFYNQTRPHQMLDRQTPDQVYNDNPITGRTATWSAWRHL
jgi:putative transposase